MSKLGISIQIDVSKIDKARLYKGAKGTYLNLTTFVDPANPDQYDQHGFISQTVTKEERAQSVRTPILGNCTVFFQEQGADNVPVTTATPAVSDTFDDDIPF